MADRRSFRGNGSDLETGGVPSITERGRDKRGGGGGLLASLPFSQRTLLVFLVVATLVAGVFFIFPGYSGGHLRYVSPPHTSFLRNSLSHSPNSKGADNPQPQNPKTPSSRFSHPAQPPPPTPNSLTLSFPQPAEIPKDMRIAIITDLDQQSRSDSSSSPLWESYFKKGWLRYDKDSNSYSVEWEDAHVLHSAHSEAGRGMELSELCMFNNRLYTGDDRSGIVYEVVDFDTTGSDPRVYPRMLLVEGDGEGDKGMKIEWMTVKDNSLLVGSFGKEYTLDSGEIKNRWNMWVKEIAADARLTSHDWTSRYEWMRSELGYSYPGYLLHETAVFSHIMRKWLFLPRRMSKEPYTDSLDEHKGANTMILVDEQFTSLDAKTVGVLTPERGFSSAKFVPGSKDQVVVALKTAEDAEKGTQESFITVFNLDGETLLPETPIPGAHKYEGIEFLPN